MKKPSSLRAFLVDTVDGIEDDQERLAIFVDKGSVVCRPTGTLSFEYRYTLTVALMPFAGDVDLLVVPLLAWIAANQPELLEKDRNQPFTFEAEILNADETDVTIMLELSERVQVTARAGGGYEAVDLDEPSFPDRFDGVDWSTLLRQLYMNDVLAAESKDPAWLATQSDG